MKKNKLSTFEMIQILADIQEPIGLFEPHIWKDKIGDSLWHCELRSVDSRFDHGKGKTLREAVESCFMKAVGMIEEPEIFKMAENTNKRNEAIKKAREIKKKVEDIEI